MALTYPLALAAFADLLPIASFRPRLRRGQELSGLGSGQILAADLAPGLWEGEVVLADNLSHREAARIEAKVDALGGALNTFYLDAPARRRPQADPTGALLGASSPTIFALGSDNKSMTIAGLPEGYVLTEGDFFSYDYGSPSRRALHRISETVTAAGNGRAGPFEFSPHREAGVTTTLAVTLIRPAAKYIIRPGSWREGRSSGAIVSGMGFDVVQRL